MTMASRKTSGNPLCPTSTHQTRKPFYVTSCRQKNPVSLENYASELHQVVNCVFREAYRTFANKWSAIVLNSRVHFIPFQNIILLYMRNEGRSIYSGRLGQSPGDLGSDIAAT